MYERIKRLIAIINREKWIIDLKSIRDTDMKLIR